MSKRKIGVVGLGTTGRLFSNTETHLIVSGTAPLNEKITYDGDGLLEEYKKNQELEEQQSIDSLISSFSEEKLKERLAYDNFIQSLGVKTGQEFRREKRAIKKVKYKNKKL